MHPLQDLRVLNSQAAKKCPRPWGMKGQGQGQGQGPKGKSPSLAQRHCPPRLGSRPWAGGPGEVATALAPLPPQDCARPSRQPVLTELLPACLALSFPYIVLFGIRKGSAWSSWRQEGACSQGHLELSGEACPSPKSPPEPGGQQGQEGAWPFPQTQHRFQLRTGGRQDTGESKRANLGTAPTVPAPPPSLKSSWASCLLDH